MYLEGYHVGQLVQQLVDDLAVAQPDVRLAHQTTHLLTDVVLAHLDRGQGRLSHMTC